MFDAFNDNNNTQADKFIQFTYLLLCMHYTLADKLYSATMVDIIMISLMCSKYSGNYSEVHTATFQRISILTLFQFSKDV